MTVDISQAARRHRGDVQIVQNELITVAIRAGARGTGAGSVKGRAVIVAREGARDRSTGTGFTFLPIAKRI